MGTCLPLEFARHSTKLQAIILTLKRSLRFYKASDNYSGDESQFSILCEFELLQVAIEPTGHPALRV